jgi:hypothetical protein
LGLHTHSLRYRQYGRAAVNAYKLYNDPSYLSMAERAWNFVNMYTISPDQAASGSSPLKNFTFMSECQSGMR